ncbi:unnamed protein product [Paramecium sonneborni]|uniref:EGF-like domain-containing protein n=1 Tax=Paramecium sonneborni TaxID=65129 RepID=A0A8S1RJR1_9CILI|nr:unnamed protein product [Paramecium sonneborni]
MKTIIISLILVVSIVSSNRILSEISQTSNKWQFNLFTSTAEQNSQSYQLEGQELLLIQNKISEDGKNQIIMNKYLRDGTSLDQTKTLGDKSKTCSKPKVIIIPNIGFVLGWIQQTDQDTSLNLQLFNNNLTSIGEQIEISKINEEIHWDLSSEYYYLYNVGNYELLLLYKEPNNEKSWSGTIYNYNTQKRGDIIKLSNSKFIEIAQNNIGNIILLQRVQLSVINSFLIATKLNQSGQIVYSKTAQYEPRLVALSNNNFVLFYQQAEQIYYQVYNQHFDSVLFTSNSKYQVFQTPTWEFNNYFRGGQIQVLALEESVVLVGVNYNTLRFQLVQLDNDFLQFIQQREIHYEDLNIYKFTIQKTNYHTIFVQWISGNPLTLLPEFTQSLYQSELNLKLTLSNCGMNCDLCENNNCSKCDAGYILNNNKCQIKCQTNCIQCSTKNTCDQCVSGFILNNKMNCVEQGNIATQELKVSVSELTYKYNQQVKQLKDGSLLVYYSEYLNQQQVLQLRLLTSDGEIVSAHQINYLGWAGYDITVQNDTTAYLYTVEKSEGYSVIRQTQFNPRTFQFSNVKKLQIQNQGFQYREDIQDTLSVVGFENSVCLILKGLDSGDNINLSLLFYTYSGELLTNQYLGQIYITQNYSFNDEEQRFDFDYDDFYFYIIISRGCSIQLIQFNLFGQRIYEEQFQYSLPYECQNFINPSLSKISNKFKFMIAIEIQQQIIVFNWKDSVSIFQTDYKIKANKPQLLAFSDNSFVLLYEEYDLNDRFTTLKYLRYEFNEIVVDKIINSQSVLPQDLNVLNQENEYLILNWLASSSSKIQASNHVYLEKISINDNLVLGFGKQCPANCENCNFEKECVSCNADYYLNELKKCQLQCPLGCQTCATKTLCLVCQQGYQLNQQNVCEQSQKNTMAVLKDNIKIIESIDLDLAQNGNLYISWMERDEQNIYKTFIKQIDVHGSQVGNDIKINVCSEYASKIYTTSYFNIFSTICGNIEYGAELFLHFYNLNFDTRFSFWIDSGIRIIGHSIHDTPYAIQVVSEREIIIVYQIMNSENDVYLRFLKLWKHDFDNTFFIQNIQTFGNYYQKLQDLQLSFDHQYYYITFQNQVQLEDGSIQFQKQKITTDTNLYQINNEQTLDINQQLLILSNQNKLEVSNNNFQINFIIRHGNKQLFQHTINSESSSIEQLDVAATEQGFYIVWIQLQSVILVNQHENENGEIWEEYFELPPKRQIKAQGFYNNGTQITDIQDLIQSSNMPNKIFVQSVRNNQLFVIWQDQDETGQKLLATRYNKMLQLLSLNTVLCQTHCDFCQTSNSCAKCSQGYYYNTEQSQCQLICPSNCQVCSLKDTCDICQPNYYLINDQCIYDIEKQSERVLANVEDSTITRVSMSTFSDNGFVVVWNDNQNGKQTLFMQLFNNFKEEEGLFPLSGDNDRLYAQVEVLDGDLIALAWFEGQCSDTCRLQLQIFDRFGTIQTNEFTIAFVTLPPLGKQSPVVIKRYDRTLIIAFITYELGKTVGYSTIYEQDTQTVQGNQLIDQDNNVDNLQIISKNGYYHGILYVRNNNELILQNSFTVECWAYYYWGVYGCGYNQILSILSSENRIQQTSVVMRLDNYFIITWVEKTNKNGFLIDKTYFTRCWHAGCENKKELITNTFDETYLPQLVGQYGQFGQYRYSIIYGTQDYLSHIRQMIKLQSFFDYESVERTIQISIQSQIIKQLVTFEFANGDVFILTVGQTGESTNQILMNIVNLFGDQQKLIGHPNCQQHCQRCDASLTCFNCNIGYNLIDGQCQRQCDKNCRICDPYWDINLLQCYECEFGYQLNNFQQCLPTDTSIIQSLINTYQSGNQYGQRVATLSNYQSIVVWNSENQDKNGKSIYMQLYDQQMSKIGSETLVTKDNIGIQEEPDIVALPNNQFIIIWKDNHSNTGRRILMQRFTLALERVGDEIVVYDSLTDIVTTDQQKINYVEAHHQIVITERGQISILLFLQQSSNIFDIKLKQYNTDYQEITSKLIGQTLSQEQTSISTINTLLLLTWKSKEGIRVIFVNEYGSSVNGLLIQSTSSHSYPSIIAISENEILISCVGTKYNQLLIYKQNLELTLNENPKVIQLDYQIQDVNLLRINSGYVIAFKQKKQTPQYQSDLINLLIFDNNDNQIQSNSIQVNDYYGLIRDIRMASLSNDEFIITWTQIINNINGGPINERNIQDQSGNGVYVKRFNMAGQVQSIENIVCQSYCKQCSKSNLCEACSDGYQFDEQKLICLPICQSNCNYCTKFLGQYKSYCQSCKEGFIINELGDCVKQQEQKVSQLYQFDGGDFRVSQILTLSNGNIVVIYYMNYGDVIFIDIIDNAGQVIVQRKQLEGSCCKRLTKATALTNGNFAVVQRSFEMYYDGGFQLFIFDSEGRIIKSDLLFYPNYWGYPEFWRNQNLLQINSLSDGGFVLLFVTNSNQAAPLYNPQLHLRIYSKEYYLVRSDIIIQTYFNRGDNYYYYWDYWYYYQYYSNAQSQAITVLESVNSIIISFGTHLYNNWDENKNNIQMFVYSKEGQFILNKQIDIPNNDWWIAGYTPRFFLFEIELNKFLLIYFNNRQVFGQYYDEKFNLQVEKSINLESSNYNHCYGCCIGCWDYISSQVALIKNVIVITNKPNPIELYISSYNLNFNAITSPFKVSNDKFDYGDYYRHSHHLINYQLETLLLAQTFYYQGNRYMMLDKFDKNCNKIKQWTGCDDQCLECAENNKQCLTCKNGYFVDENRKCKQNCDIQSCLYCENIGSQAQFCRVCQDGYQLKDNIECVQIDNSRIKETKLSSSGHAAQNTPRIKALQDGRILLVSLSQNYRILGQFYNSIGEAVGDQIVLLEEDGINHFDFAVSPNQDQIVIAWVSNTQLNAKALKFNIDLQTENNQQIIIVDYIHQYGIQQITVEYLQNNSFVCVLFGDYRSWIRTINEFNEPQNIQQFYQNYYTQCDYWGNCYYCDLYSCYYCGWYQCYGNPYYYYYGYYGYWYRPDIQQRYIDYFTASYEREPSVLITQNYIVVASADFTSIQLATFDLNGNLLFQNNLQYQNLYMYAAAYQPSIAQLENGKIVIAWKDILIQYNNLHEQQVESYKQTVIAYTITDESFQNIQIKYIGMDYVQEERPDVAAISNGFAISWSGRSERNNQNIDLRIAYFDLYGNLQTGFIPVSSICSRPINSQISKLNDGSVFVSWYQDNDIYVQKLDRNGVLYPLPQPISCPQYCNKCNKDFCLECFIGYELNSSQQCQLIIIEPQCWAENCQICEFGGQRCMLCKEGYFLEEQFNICSQIDNAANKEYLLAKSNVINDHSTAIVQVDNGIIIHLWLDVKENEYVLKGSTYNQSGSQFIDKKEVQVLPKDVYMQVKSQNSNIIVLIYNQEISSIYILNSNLEVVNPKVDIQDIIKQEFSISFEWWNQKLNNYNYGFVIEITGIKQQIINQFSLNPEIKRCTVTKIFVFDFSVQLTTQPFGFYMDGQPSTGIVDQDNQCKISQVHDVLYDNKIYVLVSRSDLNRQKIQAYDYNGEKIRESFIDQWNWYGWDWWYYQAQLKLYRLNEFQILIVGREGKGIKINSENFLDEGIADYYYNFYYYCIDQEFFKISSDEHLQLVQQEFGLVSRWMYSVNPYYYFGNQRFVSRSAVKQQSFNVLRLQNGQQLFSWIEAANNQNKGSIMIVRLNQNRELDSFQNYQCLSNCNKCSNDYTCEFCNDHYENINNVECRVICPSLCEICYEPTTCQVCQENAYLNDNGQCYVPETPQIEISIPIKRSDDQLNPRVASFIDGSFVIVWQSENQDGDGYGIYVQKFNSQIEKIGDEIRVNVNILNNQYYPDITILENQNVIIVWADGNIETQATLYYQRFSQDLQRIGTPVIIDNIKVQYIQQYDTPFVVQSLPLNKFVICWINSVDWMSNLYVSLIDSNGVQVNTFSLNYPDQVREVVIASNSLNFVVITKYKCQLRAIVFNLDGNQQQSSDLWPGCSTSAGITANSLGEYIVTYIEAGSVVVQQYNSQFGLINTTPKLDQDGGFDSEADNPDVITLNGDKIVVVWQNNDRWATPRSRKLKMQILDNAGVTISDVKEVNLLTTYAQLPQLSLLNNDEFIVVWQGVHQKSLIDSEYGIYLMRFNHDGIKTNPSVPICPDKCEKCQESKTCFKCQLDYELVNNQCKPKCPQNCSFCDTSNICDICQPGFELNTVGNCLYINPDPLPGIVPFPQSPIREYPSFKSIQKYGSTSVLIYGASIIQRDSKNYLDVNLILISEIDNSNSSFNSMIEIDGEWLNIYNSDILVVDDEIIIYWTEQSYSVNRIQLKQLRLNSNLIQQGLETIDSFDFNWNEHINRKVYLFYFNSNYYIFHSVLNIYGQYEFYAHIIDKQGLFVKVALSKLGDTYNIIQRKQILIVNNEFIVVDYQLEIRWFKFDQNLQLQGNFISTQYFQGGVDYSSITIEYLPNQQYVCAWRSRDQQYTQMNYIYYRFLTLDFQFTSEEQKVIASNNVIQNPQIVVTNERFYIIWNQESIVSSMINCKQYDLFGNYINEIQKLNRLDNNVQFYTGTNISDDNIVIIWISYSSTIWEYQYYIAKVGPSGRMPIGGGESFICPTGCEKCQNEYSCAQCLSGYFYDSIKYKCYLPCTNNCKDCLSELGICKVCNEGYKLTNNNCDQNICQQGCQLCDELQNCLKCNAGFEALDKYTCKYYCDVNCEVCGEDKCNQCKESYYWSDQDKLCVDITIYIYQTTKDQPLKAVFESKDYVLMWYETGSNEGIYIQLYRSNGKPVGRPTKVNEEDLLGTRRLLQQSNNFDVRLFADLTAIKNELVVLWVDQTQGDLMKVKFKKFDNNNKQLSSTITISEQPKQNLTSMAAPCIIKPTTNNQFVIGWFNKQEENLKQTATMFIQSFNTQLIPIGTKSAFQNADFTKIPLIQASENGDVYITYTSQGYTYLAQMSQDGEQKNDPIIVSHVYQTIKSTNLDDGNMVYVFESQSTNVSPPQFVLSYEIVKQDKKENQPRVLTQQQYGEQHPDIVAIAGGFVIAWRSVDKSFKSQDIYFQIFDNSGEAKSQQIKAKRYGLHPQSPRIQILNQDELVISWTAESIGDSTKNSLFQDSFKLSVALNNSTTEDQNINKIVCSSNCLYCETSNTCIACQDGYYTVNNQCVIDCPLNCQSCSTPLICNVCDVGYQNTTGHQCEFIGCDQGYKLNDDNECVPECSENCLECQSLTQCLECDINYYLNNGKCQSIPNNIETYAKQSDKQMPYYQIIIIIVSILLFLACLFYSYKLYQKNLLKRTNGQQLANQVEEGIPQNTIINTMITANREQPENLQFD